MVALSMYVCVYRFLCEHPVQPFVAVSVYARVYSYHHTGHWSVRILQQCNTFVVVFLCRVAINIFTLTRVIAFQISVRSKLLVGPTRFYRLQQ